MGDCVCLAQSCVLVGWEGKAQPCVEGVQRFSGLRVGVQSAGSDPKKKIKGRSLARHGVTSVPRYVSGGSLRCLPSWQLPDAPAGR